MWELFPLARPQIVLSGSQLNSGELTTDSVRQIPIVEAEKRVTILRVVASR